MGLSRLAGLAGQGQECLGQWGAGDWESCPGHHPNKNWASAAPANVSLSPSSLVKYDHATAMSYGPDQLGAELLTAMSSARWVGECFLFLCEEIPPHCSALSGVCPCAQGARSPPCRNALAAGMLWQSQGVEQEPSWVLGLAPRGPVPSPAANTGALSMAAAGPCCSGGKGAAPEGTRGHISCPGPKQHQRLGSSTTTGAA